MLDKAEKLSLLITIPVYLMGLLLGVSNVYNAIYGDRVVDDTKVTMSQSIGDDDESL